MSTALAESSATSIDASSPVFDHSRICTRAGHCAVCAAPNGCRLESGIPYKGPCWCERPVLLSSTLQRLLVELPEQRCLCRGCLETIAAHPEVTWDELAARVRPVAPFPPSAGDFYMEGDSVVFTAQYHLRRGWCCGSGCRHCPFSSDLHPAA
jgi:hypothetical protein